MTMNKVELSGISQDRYGWTREMLAQRLIQDIEPGWVINIGIGFPSEIVKYADVLECMLHTENGLLGMGTYATSNINYDIIDPGKNPVTMKRGASLMDSSISFGLMRGGHLDLSVMGAYQVSMAGDLANWRIPNKQRGGIGGAADLVAGAKRIWVMMTHTDRSSRGKILTECTYPLTGRGCVERVYTNLGVFEPVGDGLEVIELASGVDIETVRANTGCPLFIELT